MVKSKHIVSELLRPVIYMAVLLFACALLILGHTVVTLNVMEREQSAKNMDISLAVFRQSLERVTIDYSWWDEAVQNLVIERNQNWIGVNISADALITTGSDAVFVADGQNAIWHSMFLDGTTTEMEKAIDDLLVLFQSARNSPADNPMPSSGYILLGERLYLASAGAITGQELDSSPAASFESQSILGFMQEVNSKRLGGISDLLRLENLYFQAGGDTTENASITLTSPTGQRLGSLQWQSSKPGTDFLLVLLPVLSSILVIVLICTLVIVKRTTKVAKRLVSNEHFLEEKNQKLETSLSELAKANQQVREASKAKTEFLTNVSHELRTPLNAIIGFSEIICEQRMGTIGNPKYVEYARDINKSGDHLLSLINEILDLSKIKSGQFRLSLENTELNETVQTVIKLFETDAAARDVDLVFANSEDEIVLWADGRAIRQILINLIGNALKFTPAKGSVTVKTEIDKDNHIALTIEDTGIGIPQDQIQAALTPFQQIDGSLNRKHGGTGLGLPLSQQLAELHDGRLEIESAPHQGTKVTVTFPPKSLRKINQGAQIAS